jgi:hypothetical protein
MYLHDLGVDVRIILKWILREWCVWRLNVLIKVEISGPYDGEHEGDRVLRYCAI